MLTYEMVGLADQNDRTYISTYGTYDVKNGFKFNESVEEVVKDVGWRGFVNILFHDNLWKLKKEPLPKLMTLQDVEKELGYRVQIVDPEPEKKEVSPERKKEVDDTIDVFRRFLGIDLDPNNYY